MAKMTKNLIFLENFNNRTSKLSYHFRKSPFLQRNYHNNIITVTIDVTLENRYNAQQIS